MHEKIREAIRLAATKGIKVESIGRGTGWWVTVPSQPRKRIPGAGKLLALLSTYN